MSQTGSGVLASLRNKMQQQRDDLDKYKDLYEEKCQDFEEERSKRQDVGLNVFNQISYFGQNIISFKYVMMLLGAIIR